MPLSDRYPQIIKRIVLITGCIILTISFSVYSWFENAQSSHPSTRSLCGGSSNQACSQEGTAGIIGASGSDGAYGQTGATGFEGSFGQTGATGLPGDLGEAGTLGLPGTTGCSGATGFTGGTGFTGATGNQGTLGMTGSSGITGATGPNSQGLLGTPSALYYITQSEQMTTMTTGTTIHLKTFVATNNNGTFSRNADLSAITINQAGVYKITCSLVASGSTSTALRLGLNSSRSSTIVTFEGNTASGDNNSETVGIYVASFNAGDQVLLSDQSSSLTVQDASLLIEKIN